MFFSSFFFFYILIKIDSFKHSLPTDYILPIVARSSIHTVQRPEKKPSVIFLYKTEETNCHVRIKYVLIIFYDNKLSLISNFRCYYQ